MVGCSGITRSWMILADIERDLDKQFPPDPAAPPRPPAPVAGLTDTSPSECVCAMTANPLRPEWAVGVAELIL